MAYKKYIRSHCFHYYVFLKKDLISKFVPFLIYVLSMLKEGVSCLLM
jgi:hypothetical protein